MSREIKYLSLQKTELEYEVEIRGEAPADNVQDLRKQIVKQVKFMPAEDILESHLDAKDDIEGAKESLFKLQSNIQMLMTKHDKSLYLRSLNLAHHIYHRLVRIHPLSSDEVNNYKDCKLRLKTFEMDLSSMSAPSVNQSSNVIDNVKDDLPLTNVSVTCDRGISTDLSKLRFDGKTCVRAFIQKVEEFIKAREIKPSRVLAFATEIFTGDALHWFRSKRSTIVSLDQLLILLKQDFDQYDYDYRLMNEIRCRTQGEHESIIIYIAVMEGMFSRLSKIVSEDEKLEILLHNIRPCYASTLACRPEIKSISELSVSCRNFENYNSKVSNFREPPKITTDTLAPEFAYNKHKSNFIPSFSGFDKKSSIYTTSSIESSNVDALNLYKTKNTSYAYCPRCRSNSHSLKNCKEPKYLICFKCGLKDVRFPDCPNCNTSASSKDNKPNPKN